MTRAAVCGIKTRSPMAPAISNRKRPRSKMRCSTRRSRSRPRQTPVTIRNGNARLSLSIFRSCERPSAVEQHQRQTRPECNDYHGDQRHQQKWLGSPVDFRDVLLEAMAGDEQIQADGRRQVTELHRGEEDDAE